LNGREISALVGVAPINRDSGTMRGKRTIFGGGASAQGAVHGLRSWPRATNPVIKAFYPATSGRSKPKKVALTACARKLLIILNAMVRTRQPFDSRVTWLDFQDSCLVRRFFS